MVTRTLIGLVIVVAAIALGVWLVPAAAETPSEFTAIGQENGTIVLDGDTDDPIKIPECDGEEPLPENADEGVEWEETCVTVNATVQEGEWNGTLSFPTITDTDPDSVASEATVEITAPDEFAGTIDTEDGSMTAVGPLEITADIDVPLGFGDVCTTETVLVATTGESGDLEGEPLENGTATLVDGEFEVPAFPEGSTACDGANDAYGLPSDEGDSLFELPVEVDLAE